MQAFIDACAGYNITISKQVALAPLCGFNTGSVAEYFVAPDSKETLQIVLQISSNAGITVTVLGGGSNVLAPDSMLKGLTISTARLNTIFASGTSTGFGTGVNTSTGLGAAPTVSLDYIANTANTKRSTTAAHTKSIAQFEGGAIVQLAAGTTVRAAAQFLASKGKRGLDFLYGMPGTIGGALWMNARCYGKEVSDVLVEASGFRMNGTLWTYHYKQEDFAYKRSPFQTMDFLQSVVTNANSPSTNSLNTTEYNANSVAPHRADPTSKDTSAQHHTQAAIHSPQGIITDCKIRLRNDDVARIWQDMLAHEMDRHSKGHYIAPCAGSVFKNNYKFNAPSGQLLDQLGWRNKQHRGASVNPFHANIIINSRNAKSKDIYDLSLQMQQSVQKEFHYRLEHEIVLLGEASQWKS